MATATLQATSAASGGSLARASGRGQGGSYAHTERRGRWQRRRPLRVRSGVVHSDTHIGLDAHAGGETAYASDPRHSRSPHSSSAHGTSSSAEVQQGKHRGQSTSDEGGVPSVSAATGEEETERALGKRMLKQ